VQEVGLAVAAVVARQSLSLRPGRRRVDDRMSADQEALPTLLDDRTDAIYGPGFDDRVGT